MNKFLYMAFIVVFHCNAHAFGKCESVIPDSDSKYPYKKYIDKCEGLFSSAVSVGNTILEVKSFTKSFGEYDKKDSKPLTISNPSSKYLSNINIIAESVDGDTMYRMDTVINKLYEWKIQDVLSPVGIERKSLGVVASTKIEFQGNGGKLLIPVNIQQGKVSNNSDKYELILWPWIDIKSISYSVASVNNDNDTLKYLILNKGIDNDYFGYEEPVIINLKRYKDVGIYYLRLSYETEDGIAGSIQFWYENS